MVIFGITFSWMTFLELIKTLRTIYRKKTQFGRSTSSKLHYQTSVTDEGIFGFQFTVGLSTAVISLEATEAGKLS